RPLPIIPARCRRKTRWTQRCAAIQLDRPGAQPPCVSTAPWLPDSVAHLDGIPREPDANINPSTCVHARVNHWCRIPWVCGTFVVAAAALSVSPATAHRWWQRWKNADEEARTTLSCLFDRPSRPHHSPRRLAPELEHSICECRLRTGWGPRLVA